MDNDEIMRLLQALQTAGVEYVLIGAAAMGFHGLVRATQDLDLFIRTTAENIERLRSALRVAYPDDPHISEIFIGRLAWRLPVRPLRSADM